VHISGFKIPARSNVVMSQWIMHRDQRYFADPHRFEPSRWLNGSTQRLPRYAYFPFGGGPRLCIGASFAMMEATLVLATIAQRFSFRLLPGHVVKPVPSITLRPQHGIRVSVLKRDDAVREPSRELTNFVAPYKMA
jgi:cytochrome P450